MALRLDRATALLVRAIRDYDLTALALAGATRSAPSLASALRRAGFEPTFEDAHYTPWASKPTSPGLQNE